MAPIRSGDLLGKGVGLRAAHREQAAILERLNRRLTLPVVTEAISVSDSDVWDFMAWYRTVERRAEADCADAGGDCSGSGAGDGIPLSRCQRLTVEIPALLRRLMEDAESVLDALDKSART